MTDLSLASVLRSTEGLLQPLRQSPDEAQLQTFIRGIELHQPESSIDYRGRLVLVSVPVRTCEALDEVIAECQGAAALILNPSTTPELADVPTTVLLSRSRWASTDVLLRALTILTGTSDQNRAENNPDVVGAHARNISLEIHRRESALMALLHGIAEADVPATILGLRPDLNHVVLAIGADAEAMGQIRLALSTEFSEERSVITEGILYVVLPIHSEETYSKITSRLRARLRRVTRLRQDLPVGIGSVVYGVYRLHESAAVAREIIRALRFKLGVPALSAAGELRVAEAADVEDTLVLIRAGDALRSQGKDLAAPLKLLSEYDHDHRSELLRTVLITLEHRNSTAEAARRLGIHANSLRSRLDRIQEISGIDLAEPVSAMRAIVAFLASPDMHNAARPTR